MRDFCSGAYTAERQRILWRQPTTWSEAIGIYSTIPANISENALHLKFWSCYEAQTNSSGLGRPEVRLPPSP
jgi:hypothetical protein